MLGVRAGEIKPRFSHERRTEAETPTMRATSLMRKNPWAREFLAELFVEDLRMALITSFPLTTVGHLRKVPRL